MIGENIFIHIFKETLSDQCYKRHVKASWSVSTRRTALVSRVLQGGRLDRNRPQTLRTLGGVCRQQWSRPRSRNSREKSCCGEVPPRICGERLPGQNQQQTGACKGAGSIRACKRGGGNQCCQLCWNYGTLQLRCQQQRAFCHSPQVWGRLERSGKEKNCAEGCSCVTFVSDKSWRCCA